MADIDTDKRAYNSLIEKAEEFEVLNQSGEMERLRIYPFQLGRLAEISTRLLKLDIAFNGKDDNAVKKMWEICSTRPREVAEIIAIATLRTKEDIENHFDERVELLMWSPTMTADAYKVLLHHIVSISYYEDFTNAIRLVKTLQVSLSLNEVNRIASITDGEPSGDN